MRGGAVGTGMMVEDMGMLYKRAMSGNFGERDFSILWSWFCIFWRSSPIPFFHFFFYGNIPLSFFTKNSLYQNFDVLKLGLPTSLPCTYVKPLP